jgi:hypothetical protein
MDGYMSEAQNNSLRISAVKNEMAKQFKSTLPEISLKSKSYFE